MGDRCYLEITYRKDQHSIFQKQLQYNSNYDWHDGVMGQTDTWVHVCVDEANYGLMSDREALNKQGIPFYGWHTPGGDYEACVFAAVDGELSDVIGKDEGPHARLNEDGSIHPTDLKDGMRYYDILKKAREQIYMKINGFYSASPDYP